MFLSRPFAVPRRDRPDPRLVVDLSRLNRFIPCRRFRMLSLGQVRSVLSPGAWLTSLDLASAYWHVPVAPRFRSFLAVQDGSRVLRFTVLPFGLNIAPRVFTKLTKVLAALLASRGLQVLMYLDDWLVQAASFRAAQEATTTTIALAESLGFAFNLPKSSLVPAQRLVWLGASWDTAAATVGLSMENQRRLVRKLRLAVVSRSFTWTLWMSLMGSLNFAAGILPPCRLFSRRLWWEGNRLFHHRSPDVLLPFPARLRRLLWRWLRPGFLSAMVPWVPPLPALSVVTDASDSGWGFQSSTGLQGAGLWSAVHRRLHINARELLVPVLFLLRHPHLRSVAVCFRMDSQVAVHCVMRLGSSRSLLLQRVSERLFRLAWARSLHLSAVYVPGSANIWADALSRSAVSSVEWSLTDDAFWDLVDLFGLPQVDLFASWGNARLPLFLTRSVPTAAGGPDAFLVDWGRWDFIYLFPPPAVQVLTRVCDRLRRFLGRVLLVAPLWPAQPWCQFLLQYCPNPLPLNPGALQGPGLRQSGMSSDFHAWIFSDCASSVPSLRR